MPELDRAERERFWQRPLFVSRVVSSLVAIAGVVAIVASPGWVVALMLVPISFEGSRELFTMLEARGVKPARRTTMALSLAMLVLTPWLGTSWHLPFLSLGILAIALAVVWRGNRWSSSGLATSTTEDPALATTADATSSLLAFLLLGWLPSHIPLLRDLQPGPLLAGVPAETLAQPPQLGMVLVSAYYACIVGTDIGAYLVGMVFGKTPLIGALSPKKTLEGALGGTLVAIGAVLTVARAGAIPPVPMVAFAVVVSLAGQVGDLFESLIKRDAGFKDSGSIIPGHGGILDRVDSYLLSAALAYQMVTLVFPLAQPR
jgi:phosphatidate cytidylyltransferase